MKLKFISDDDVNAIKEDRKVLEKLAKKYGKLREKAGNFEVFSPDEEHYHMFKELQKLKNDATYYNEQVNNSIFVSDFYNEEVLLKTWKEYYQRIYLKWKSKKETK